MRLLLDTNSFVAVMNRRDERVMRRMVERRDELVLSAVVAFKLYFGAFNSDRVDRNLAEIALLGLPTIPFEVEDARAAGEIRAALRRAGTPIGPYDVLIAGQALARDLVLVTANTREFARVARLRLEDWTRD